MGKRRFERSLPPLCFVDQNILAPRVGRKCVNKEREGRLGEWKEGGRGLLVVGGGWKTKA